jgi:chaperone required for assembly of F1-ATPase
MSDWKAKRFWTDVTIAEVAGGFGIRLDGRVVRTPGKSELVVPTLGLARLIADEWNAQTGVVDPRTMPSTRFANSAIEKVANQHHEVADLLVQYGDSDLLCYRADSPAELVARQSAVWDPYLDWAKTAFGAKLLWHVGVIHVPQDPANIARLSNLVHAMTNFELAAFHDLVGLSGSLILGLAAVHRRATSDTLWLASRVDEIWQIEQWGADDEATVQGDVKAAAFSAAYDHYHLCDILS